MRKVEEIRRYNGQDISGRASDFKSEGVGSIPALSINKKGVSMMKMKIEIDIQDLINNLLEDACEYDSEYGVEVGDLDIKQAIQNSIKNTVICELLPKMKTSIEEGITKSIDSIIKERVEKTVEHTLEKVLNGGDIKIGRDQLTITKYIEDLFSNSRVWSSPVDQLKKMADEYARTMKAQYNTIFATQIVENMREQGLLKEDFAKMLTTQKD